MLHYDSPRRRRKAIPGVTGLLQGFGSAAEFRDAALFVGAGLSTAAGFPDWGQLLEPLLVPLGLSVDQSTARESQRGYVGDFPLAAEYIAAGTDAGRAGLDRAVLDAMHLPLRPTVSHELIAELPVGEIWTTNYDRLIEQADPDSLVIRNDSDWRAAVEPGRRRIVKMHGSIADEGDSWAEPPVITRTDYERYEERFPVTAQRLRATFLTMPMLFLGFSFSDPNVELLLRLARTVTRGPGHFAVLRRPPEGPSRTLHDLRVQDLRQSGVEVVEIDEYSAIEDILRRLVRRTRPPRLFVGGSLPEDNDDPAYDALCRRVGAHLGEILRRQPRVTIVSLAGRAGLSVSRGAASVLRASDRYEPQRFEFHFRRRDEVPEVVPAHPERVGTLIFDGYELEELRRRTLDECRAMVVIGGGERTAAEIALARQLGVPVVPVAVAGGAGEEAWRTTMASVEGAPAGDLAHHEAFPLLGHEDLNVALAASERLVCSALNISAT